MLCFDIFEVTICTYFQFCGSGIVANDDSFFMHLQRADCPHLHHRSFHCMIKSASLVVAQLLFLESEDPNKDINLYINSPGGSVTAGMAIYDTMNYIKCDVCTTCIGMAASMGAFLLSSGAKGKRFALPNAEVMIHQPSGGAQGQATEIKIVAEQILKTKEKLNKILAANTGQPLDVIARDTERDNYMTAEEAAAYGLIDRVITGH